MRLIKLSGLAALGALVICAVMSLAPPGPCYDDVAAVEEQAIQTELTAERFRSDPILAPDRSIARRAVHCGMTCALLRSDGVRVWYTGKEADDRFYHICRADFDAEWKLIDEAAEPVLKGTPGGFDAAGVFMPCVIDCRDHLRMYYACHSGGEFPGPNSSAAMAISKDGGDTWEKVGQTIRADRQDRQGVGTNFAWQDVDGWRMLYTHVEGVRPAMRFFIKSARSDDGIKWERPEDNVALDPGSGTCARPMVFKAAGRYVMVYSDDSPKVHREVNYRVRWAESADGWKYVDKGRLLGIVPDHAWENELVSYPWAIPERGVMFYTGDWFGKTGFGVVKLSAPASFHLAGK